MKMTIEDIVEYKKNAIDTLESNGQYATAKASEMAFNALIYLEQNQWGVGSETNQDVDRVVLSNKEYEELLEYKRMYEGLCK